ncbi:MAG: glycosyl hydrolase family 65 protein, partial [Clostridia bacterium]
WRTINGEEASTYFPLGTAQYHINGDIANAVWQYVQATDDIAFLRDYGFEMLCEISRVWADVGCFADVRGGQYCICSVTGPDEYNAIVDNNFYTNLLAQENLRQTLQALHLLKQREPAAAEALTAKLGISQEECALWKRVADQMCLPYDEKLGVYVQDDGFLMRKPWDDSFIAPEKRHLLYENFHPLFIYRQRMCKQADAILGMQMFSERFTDEELRRNYDFYQTVTLHHSSLSTSIFGILACRVGYPQQAYEYFQQSARMDLDDCHRNVYAGIHAANMAGTWLNIVQGFAGFRIKEGMPEFSVMLPPQWKGYRFHMLWQGKRLLVDVQESGVDFTLEQGDALTWLYRGEKRKLSRGETIHESL